MPEQSCRHTVGPVVVEHRPGVVWTRCAACDVVVSGWLGDEHDGFEAIELRGAAEEVKDHLDRFHRDVDLRSAEVLRLCAWKHAEAANEGARRAEPVLSGSAPAIHSMG